MLEFLVVITPGNWNLQRALQCFFVQGPRWIPFSGYFFNELTCHLIVGSYHPPAERSIYTTLAL